MNDEYFSLSVYVIFVIEFFKNCLCVKSFYYLWQHLFVQCCLHPVLKAAVQPAHLMILIILEKDNYFDNDLPITIR